MVAEPPEQVLTGFVRALRAAGARTSTAETLDAVRAVALIGWSDRAAVKAALASSLAKSVDDKHIHDRLFDRYFDSIEPGDPDSTSSAAAGTDASQAATVPASTGEPALDALLALVEAHGAEGATGGATGGALRRALARAGEAEQVDDIRLSTQVAYLAQRVLERLGVAALEARLALLSEDESAAAQAQARRLELARSRLRRAARQWVAQRFELFGRPATERFMTDVVLHRPMGRLAPADMARMKAAVTRMARRLAQRHLRRQRRRQRGILDMRRTLRANAGHDGVPFTILWRNRKRDRPRIVAVCDVSGSVAAHVRFLLLFLHAMHDVVDDLRTFAFSNALHDVGWALASLPFDDAMARILKDAGAGSTDYGQAWIDLHADHDACVDRRTTLIVLGDGRSNRADPRVDRFAGFASRARRVVWLCPEAPDRWGSGDSEILRYAPWCTILRHCATPLDLERIIDEALLAHH